MKRVAPLLAVLSVVSCATTPTNNGNALALVNGESITVEDLTEQFVRKHGGHAVFLGGEAEARRFLEIIIEDRLLIQEAYNLQIEKTPVVADAVREQLERKSVDYLVKTEIDDRSVPTEEQIRAAWQTRTSDLMQVRQILVPTRQEAEEIRRALDQGGDFEKFARECSSSPSSKYGGRLATIGWGSREEAWEDAVRKLEPGEISQPIRTKEGWELALLESRETAELPEFEAAKPRVESILRDRAKERRRKEYSAELWARHGARFAAGPLDLATLIRRYQDLASAALVTWNGGAVTLGEVASHRDLVGFTSLPPVRAEDDLESRVRATVNQRLLLLEAAARNVAGVPEVAEVVRKFQERRMQDELYSRHVLKNVNVTDEDVARYYEEKKAELVRPEKRRISHIVVADEVRARDLREKIAGGADFDELVRAHSIDSQTARSGGDLGWVTGKNTPDEFGEVLTLAIGEVSRPIRSQYGWHLIRLVEIVPSAQLSFEEIREDLREHVTQQRRRDARETWLRQLREVADIEINDEAILRYVREHPAEQAPETGPSHGAPPPVQGAPHGQPPHPSPAGH